MPEQRHTRLSKESSAFIKSANKVIFVTRENIDLSQNTIVLIFNHDEQFVIAQDGDMNFWIADDIVKAKRSIKRLNNDCEIYDRRDYIIRYALTQKPNYYAKILDDLTTIKSEISALDAINIVNRLDSFITELERLAQSILLARSNTINLEELYSNYSDTVDRINDLRKVRYQESNIVFQKLTLTEFQNLS